MTPKPGDEAGECINCGSVTWMIGYAESVFGVHCEDCGLVNMTPQLTLTGGREYVPAHEYHDNDDQEAVNE